MPPRGCRRGHSCAARCRNCPQNQNHGKPARFYDHVEPPAAVPPDDHHEEYTFDRLGIRVPALLISPWVKQGFDATLFDHTSLLKYLTAKWGLGPLGKRTAQANSIENLVRQDAPRTGTVERIELTPDQLRPPKPDLEAEAAKYISGHHKALALIGRQLQLELLKEWPLAFGWVSYILETLLHWLFGLGNRWVFRLAHQQTKQHWSDFRERKKQQALPKLARIIRDLACSQVERKHAVETLGLVINKEFHHAADPVGAADTWLRQAGH